MIREMTDEGKYWSGKLLIRKMNDQENDWSGKWLIRENTDQGNTDQEIIDQENPKCKNTF